jgi:hypothetical protein
MTNMHEGVRQRLRDARVGDILPPDFLAGHRRRRLAATAVLLPGAQDLDDYRRQLDASATDFAAWDGMLVALEADGAQTHRLVIVDRYGQVYDVTDSADAAGLPSASALEEWFKFLATACPECGVLDDPVASGPVP